MCLVTFARNSHPDYPLILLANRDELYSRPSAPVHFWQDHPAIVGGRDLEQGGTWLGLNRTGRFATLTNHPFADWQPHQPTQSRGHLVSRFLMEEAEPEAYLEVLRATRQQYEGYHLIFGTLDQLFVYSNVSDDVVTFEPGIYGISNTYDDLSRHKEQRSVSLLQDYLANHAVPEIDDLLNIFRDAVPSDHLEDYPPQLEAELVRKNSAIFITGQHFGTVGTTALLIDKQGQVQLKEVRFNQLEAIETTEEVFYLDKHLPDQATEVRP